jgi:hypothetical protein
MSRIGPDLGRSISSMRMRLTGLQPSRLGELLVLMGVRLGAANGTGAAAPGPSGRPRWPGRRPGHRRAPVDDDRVAIAVMDVTAPDVQPFARQRPRWPVRPAALAVAAPRRFRRAGSAGNVRIHNGAFA